MNKICIIGSQGYIGMKLTSYFVSKYINLTLGLVDLGWFLPKESELLYYNNDYNNITTNYLKDFDVIILVAGHSSVRMSEGSPLWTFNNNVRNFINLLPKIKPHQKFIYAGSIRSFNHLESGHPITAYDLSKYEMDSYMELYAKQHPELQYFGLRFGSVNGYSSNIRTDMIINDMYFMAKNNQNVIIANTNTNKSILGMNDLCRAVESVIEKGNLSNRGIYNVVSFNKTIGEIGKKVSQYLNVDLNILNGDSNIKFNEITSEKFSKTFDFLFNDSVESIVDSFEKNKIVFKSDRNTPKEYEN